MYGKKIILEGGLCSNILHSFNPYIREGKERVSINDILYEFYFGSELMESNDSVWHETMDMFRITIERLY